ALPLFEELLSLRRKKLGQEHPDALAAMDQLGLVYMAIAAQQAWLGQIQERNAICAQVLGLAADTRSASLADNAAKTCSLAPADETKNAAALALARRAVDLGKKDRFSPYFHMSLGMAEYRSGHLTEADAALTAALESGKSVPIVAGTSAFYRAMTLFRQ